MTNRRNAATLRAIWGLLVLLMAATSACSNDTQPANTLISTGTLVPAPTNTPTTKFPSTPKSTAWSTATPTPVEPAAREALENTLKDPMVQIAERVPGFGGVFPDSTEWPGFAQQIAETPERGSLIRRPAAETPARRVPSAGECRWCDITAEDCSERVEGEARGEWATEDF